MRRDKQGHEWKWSPTGNGRARCRRCGMRRYPRDHAGPRGGTVQMFALRDYLGIENLMCPGTPNPDSAQMAQLVGLPYEAWR